MKLGLLLVALMPTVLIGCKREPLPNLVIDRARAERSAIAEWAFFEHSDCAVVEGCAADAGPRRLLRFDLVIENRGEADAVVGSPVGPGFQLSNCHRHQHYLDFARFKLGPLETTKMGGCFRDDQELDGGHRGLKYTCDNQGLQVGYADVYARDLDCQWVDVSTLDAGKYTLEIEINSGRRIEESCYEDDHVEIPVVLP